MKKLLLIAILLFATGNLFAQADGMNYQAVIINPNIQEIPGADVSGNILPNTTVSIRFTIIDANNAIEYQEVQTTTTDQYGMINLLIGIGDHDAFTLISWDGTNKDLKVEIDFKGGTNYVDMSREQLTFLPYAYHRNITATGTLKVDEDTFLKGELTVEEPTHLNSTLDVNNNSASNLTGDLTVGGDTEIEGTTNLNSSLDVNNKSITKLSGNLNVGKYLEISDSNEYDEDASTKLNGTLTVVGPTELNGLKTKDIKTNTLIVTQDPTTAVISSSTLNGSNSLNGVNDLIGENLLQGVNNLEGTNNLTGNNTLGAIDENDKNTLIGTNILSGTNTIGNSLTDVTNIEGKLSVNTDHQVKITSSLKGDDGLIGSYPLLIEGGNQGIAIKVTGTANRNNNFISFMDDSAGSLGRIEGQTKAELLTDYKFIAQQTLNASKVTSSALGVLVTTVESVFSVAEVAAAATSSTVCAGFGACVTAPIPSIIVSKGAKTILKVAKTAKKVLDAANVIADIKIYVDSWTNPAHLGVTFLSGNGDYAEYIAKENISEDFKPGELVGIKNGLVTKDVWGAEKIMIVSTQPIVLGNMPQPNNEINSEKIAFMGQVPVTVIGTVVPGDYILPNLLTSDFARAVHPKDMKTRDYKNVAGVVWNIISENSGISIVNVAVGINTNDLSDVVYQQEEELNAIRAIAEQLKIQMEQSDTVLAKLVPGYAEASGTSNALQLNQHQENTFAHKEEENTGNVIDGTVYGNDIIYFEIPEELIEQGIALARQVTLEALDDQSSMNKLLSKYVGDSSKPSTVNSKKGLGKIPKKDLNEDPFWQKMDNNPAYKEEIIQLVKSSLDKTYHTHEKDINKFNEFKIRKD